MTLGIDSPRQHISVLGIDTAYYRAGSGPTVVLLHGGAPGACSDVNWYGNFSFFVAQGFDVIAYDQPGFGHSAAPGDHTIDFRYRHAVAFLERLGVRRAFLVGNSIGGLLSVLMHARRSELTFGIDALVLAAPFPHFPVSDVAKGKYEEHRRRLTGVEPSFESVQALCRNTFFSSEKASDEIVRLRLSMIAGRNWRSLLGRRAAGNQFDAQGLERGSIDARALVIWGLNDRSVPVEVGLEAMSRFSNAQFLFLPKCGHWPQTEQSETFNEAVLAFLSAPAPAECDERSAGLGAPATL